MMTCNISFQQPHNGIFIMKPAAVPTKATDKSTSYWKSRGKNAKKLLPESFKPSEYTVLCGRSKQCFDSQGNRRFRITVKMYLEEYADAKTKPEKSAIVSKVYKLIQEASPGGGFVTYENFRWYECSERIAKEKIGASFRDFLHEKYKSSAKSKQAKKHFLAAARTGERKPNSEASSSQSEAVNLPMTELATKNSSIFPSAAVAQMMASDIALPSHDNKSKVAWNDSSADLAPLPLRTQLVVTSNNEFLPFTELAAKNSSIFPSAAVAPTMASNIALPSHDDESKAVWNDSSADIAPLPLRTQLVGTSNIEFLPFPAVFGINGADTTEQEADTERHTSGQKSQQHSYWEGV